VKRKADDSAPSTAVTAMSSAPAAASVAERRVSRTVKRPRKDLFDDYETQPGGTGGNSARKKEPLTESLKYCGVILRELFSKKHTVSMSLIVSPVPSSD